MAFFQALLKTFCVLYMYIYFVVTSLMSYIFWPKAREVAGDIVLITGAGHGIGREIALEFARRAAKVVIWDINKENNEKTASEIKGCGGEAYAYTCDLCNISDIKRVAAMVRKDVGEVDILVNNAGILYGGCMLDMSEEHIKRTFDVNVMAHFWTCREFLPSMIDRKRGHITTIASMSAKSGTAFLVDYSASKFAAFGFSEALKEELDLTGAEFINVTTVCPMFVNTGLVENPSLKYGRILQPKEVAYATVEGTLKNEEIVYLPKYHHYVQKFAPAILPRKFATWIKRQEPSLPQQYHRFKKD